jgi:D-3-phosphoglycerate dehydrogenase
MNNPKRRMPVAKYKVVVSDQVFPTVDLERQLFAEIDAELIVADGTMEDTLAKGRDADAFLNTYLSWDAAALNQLEKCKIIARYGIGVDNVDLEAAKAKGIVVTNVPDYCVEEVATHAAALALARLRRIDDGNRAVREGRWKEKMSGIPRVSGLTAGLVGYGRISRNLADILRALGMTIIISDPFVDDPSGPENMSLEELLARADVVSLHAPLLPSTKGLINAETLALMKPTGTLVNTSRGGLVHTAAVFDALRNGTIGGAALDVLEVEPIDPAELEGVPNLIVTPHMGYLSEQALVESQTKATNQVRQVLTGGSADYQVN